MKQRSRKIAKVSFKATLANLKPLWPYFVENRWALAAGVLSLLMVDFLQLVIPLIIKKAINLLVIQTSETGTLLVRQAGNQSALLRFVLLFSAMCGAICCWVIPGKWSRGCASVFTAIFKPCLSHFFTERKPGI